MSLSETRTEMLLRYSKGFILIDHEQCRHGISLDRNIDGRMNMTFFADGLIRVYNMPFEIIEKMICGNYYYLGHGTLSQCEDFLVCEACKRYDNVMKIIQSAINILESHGRKFPETIFRNPKKTSFLFSTNPRAG
jgi:hypothetical protein